MSLEEIHSFFEEDEEDYAELYSLQQLSKVPLFTY